MFTDDNRLDTSKYKKISERKKNKIWNSERCDLCGKEKQNLFHQKKIVLEEGHKTRILKKDEKACKKCLKDREEKVRKIFGELNG